MMLPSRAIGKMSLQTVKQKNGKLNIQDGLIIDSIELRMFSLMLVPTHQNIESTVPHVFESHGDRNT